MEKFDEVEKCISLPKLCGQLRLWELPEHFVFQPVDGRQLLSVNRLTGVPSLISEIPLSVTQTSVQTMMVYGVAGAIRLLAGLYVLVITGRECVGQYRGHPVFRASSLKFLHCALRDDLTIQERKDEFHYQKLLKIAETTPGLYFSYEVDLTRNTQISHDPSKVQRNQPLWQQADPKFLWNREMLKFLTDANLESYSLPLIQGNFQTKQILVHDRFITLSLISRRAVDRIGTRMWRRGADLQGNVANFVETEQVLEVDSYLASYVLVRGSIPVLWEQIVDLTYKPILNTVFPSQTPKVVDKHFQDLCARYGSVLAIDLINQQGLEGVLSIAYKNAMVKLESEKLKYVPFDFHRVCGQIQFDKLNSLHDQIADQLMQQGFYLVNSERNVTRVQKGVVRTNCIDCLDRVNVTQSLIARRALEAQFQAIGFFKLQEKIDQHPVLETSLNHLWADHGDEISIQYSGTPALKGDFVRHGRRTFFGFVQDGISALTRYYLNNFNDGTRQDAMDLVAGHYVVRRGKPSPFPFGLHELVTCMPLVSALIVVFFVCSALSLRRVDKDPGQLLYSVAWATLTACLVSAVRLNGPQFCCRPRLCKLIA